MRTKLAWIRRRSLHEMPALDAKRRTMHTDRRVTTVAAVAVVITAWAAPAVAGPPATLPDLPQPRSNMAVAAVQRDEGVYLVAANGLGAGKTYADLRHSLWVLTPGSDAWTALGSLPVEQGRLASAAVGIGERAFVLGGYTVAADGAEKSTPDVHAVDPVSGAIERLPDMPVPVDDAVALAWRDRYIILVSGWHDVANVRAVQIYDTAQRTWQSATPYPGEPVFGHAGGLVGDDLLICDGVTADRDSSGRSVYALTDACYRGRLDARRVGHIRWEPVAAHPGGARYRMAATGTDRRGPRVVFAGGSDNPYNYDGIGYNGVPAPASDAVISFNFVNGQWQTHPTAPAATMDHRALVESGGHFHLVGGMRDPQAVSAAVVSFRLAPR